MGISVPDGNYVQAGLGCGVQASADCTVQTNTGHSVHDDVKTVTLRLPSEDDEGTGDKEGRTDEVSISIEGFIKAEDEEPISKMRSAIMTGDIEGFVRAAKDRYHKLLPEVTNWDSVVDPKGDIRGAAYVEAVVRQYQKMENHIRDYYSERHQDNLNSDEPAAYIAGKYLMKDSKYFMGGMMRGEREMSYKQELAILWGGHVSLNDPYALKGYNGARNINQIDEIANKAVREKMDSLIADYKKKNGISA